MCRHFVLEFLHLHDEWLDVIEQLLVMDQQLVCTSLIYICKNMLKNAQTLKDNWRQRTWASIRAAVSAASWSFNNLTWAMAAWVCCCCWSTCCRNKRTSCCKASGVLVVGVGDGPSCCCCCCDSWRCCCWWWWLWAGAVSCTTRLSCGCKGGCCRSASPEVVRGVARQSIRFKLSISSFWFVARSDS